MKNIFKVPKYSVYNREKRGRERFDVLSLVREMIDSLKLNLVDIFDANNHPKLHTLPPIIP